MSEHKPPAVAQADASNAGPTRLRLLGDPAVIGADGSVKALERRAAGLLAFVALEPGVTRARAAGLLWPDSDDARRALRQQISRFRKIYGVELITGDAALRLAPRVEVDVLAVAGGELLGRLAFEDCDEFDAWLAQQRARRRGGEVAEIVQLLAEAEAQGDLPAAVKLAQQLVAIDPASEAHHRALMRLHYLRGDIGQAQATYDRLAAQLAREFQARPSAETEQLAQALRSARAALPIAAAAPARVLPATVLRPPRMIGRERELQTLADVWREERAALLIGEPGLGKTRLLAEFAAGRNVLVVQGRPGDAGVPYATLARLLRTALEHAPLELPAPRKTALSRLLPELAPTVPLPADGQRLLLQGAVQDVLAQVAVQGVIVDDLHFVDEASVEMLQALMAGDALKSLRWALAQRPGEGVPAAGNLRAALEEVQALYAVALSPLTESEMAALIDSLGLPELNSTALAASLTRHTGGNPLFALETLKQGFATGTLHNGRLPQPTSVSALIERRLKQLSERALALARVAAVAGEDFSIALAEHVMGARAVDLADAWSELEAAQVLREDAFAHDLVYEAVLRSIPAAISRHLHGQLAQWLSGRQGEPARIAAHWQAAGEWRHAADAWVEAAHAADRRLRYRESMQCFEQAAALFDTLADTPAHYRSLQGAVDQAAMLELDRDAYTAKVDRLIAAAPDTAARAAAHIYRLRILEMNGDSPALLREAEEVLALAMPAGLKQTEAYALMARGTARSDLQQPEAALRDFERLAVLGVELGDPEMEGAGHAARATLLSRLGRSLEALAEFEAARAIFDRSGSHLRLALVEQQLSVVQLGSGRPGAALESAERALRGAQRVEAALDILAHCRLARAMALRHLGRYAESLAALDPHLDQLDAQGNWVADRLRLELAQSHVHLGRTDLAHRLLAQARKPDRLSPAEQQRALYVELQLRALGAHGALDAGTPLPPRPQAGGDPRRRCELLRALSVLVPAAERAELLDEALRVASAFELTDERCSAQAALAQHLLIAGQVHAAAELVRVALSDEAIVPAGYPPAVAAIAHAVFSASGDGTAARRMFERAIEWIERASTGLPPEYQSSFRQRNPVNRALLEAARRVARVAGALDTMATPPAA